MGLFHLPKPGTLDDLLWRAFVRGAGWPEGEYPAYDDKTYYGGTPHGDGMLADFYAWRESVSDPDLLPMAQEPVPFPWDER